MIGGPLRSPQDREIERLLLAQLVARAEFGYESTMNISKLLNLTGNVKCVVESGEPICTNCRTNDLECVFNGEDGRKKFVSGLIHPQYCLWY